LHRSRWWIVLAVLQAHSVWAATEWSQGHRDALRNPTFQLLSYPDTLVEGRLAVFRWVCGDRVDFLSAYARHSPVLPGLRKGKSVETVIADGVAPVPAMFAWRVPRIDALRVEVVWKAYDRDKQLIALYRMFLPYRPAELEDETRDAIYVHLSDPTRQRLYLQRNGMLVFMAYCSGASTAEFRYNQQCGRRIHDHPGWFRITQKILHHRSSLNPEWYMPYSMRFYRAHHIHGTSPNQYRRLGHPASHGCIRLHRADAAELFRRVSVGFPVFIY